MKTDLSRRDFIKTTASIGAAAGMASLLPRSAGAAPARDSSSLNVYGVVVPTPAQPGPTQLFKQFQQAHSGISVQNHGFTSDRFVALFSAAQAAGEQIDLLYLNGQDLRRYALAGDLLPLNNLPYLSRFMPLGIKTYTINKTLWALPSGATGGFPIFFNQALLSKYHLQAPQTYADLLKVGQALNKQGVSTYTHDGKEIYLWPVWFFTTYAQVTGNKSVEKTIATLQGNGKFTDPEVVQALDLIFNLARNKIFSPDVLSLDTAGAQAEFLTGRAAFWLHYDGIIATTRQAAPPALNPPGVTLDVTLFPWVGSKSVKRQFPGGTGAAFGIYSKISSSRKASALQLLDYCTNDAADTYLVKNGLSTLGTNTHSQGSTDPVALKEKTILPNMSIYLDWYWPPEITQAFQQGIQAGINLSKTAKQVASDIQTVFEGLLKSGYKFH